MPPMVSLSLALALVAEKVATLMASVKSSAERRDMKAVGAARQVAIGRGEAEATLGGRSMTELRRRKNPFYRR